MRFESTIEHNYSATKTGDAWNSVFLALQGKGAGIIREIVDSILGSLHKAAYFRLAGKGERGIWVTILSRIP